MKDSLVEILIFFFLNIGVRVLFKKKADMATWQSIYAAALTDSSVISEGGERAMPEK